MPLLETPPAPPAPDPTRAAAFDDDDTDVGRDGDDGIEDDDALPDDDDLLDDDLPDDDLLDDDLEDEGFDDEDDEGFVDDDVLDGGGGDDTGFGLAGTGALPRVLQRADHPISRQDISDSALKVLYRLHRAGYLAYLCGGGVRDLMLRRKPKDFDVVTDARPPQIREVFRNARIIGRRFRLAHVLFHDGIVEVSTFRAPPDPEEQRTPPEDLLITDDNTWGDPRQDAFRRDFTINALFYNVADFSVIDWVGGIDDVNARLVRVIGEPAVRFREDPVRMLRACEFAARLGFDVERGTQEGIEACREEVLRAAPARLTEELLQLLRCGKAAGAVDWMLRLGLLDTLLPEAEAMVRARARGAGDFSGILPALDAITAEGRALDDEVLFATVILPELMLRRFEHETATGEWMSPGRFRELVDATLDRFEQRFSVPNAKRARVEQAFDGFHRMCGQRWSPAQRRRLAEKSYFDHAFSLFEVLVRATGQGRRTLDEWREARGHRPEREPRLDRRPRRRRRRRGGRS